MSDHVESERASSMMPRRGLLIAAIGLGVGAAVVGSATPALAAGGWSNPTKGRLTSGYKSPSRPTHLGSDVANSSGTAIWAAKAGKVVAVRTNSYPGDLRRGLLPGRTGNGVIIDHGSGYRTYYGHIRSASVSVGQNVSAGQYIAAMGTTGNSTGNHLHFEVHINGVTTNPYKFLAARGITLGSSNPVGGGGGWPTVKKGASGSLVRVVQHLLVAHGRKLSADGDFGSLTVTGVKNFQKSKGLVQDGVVGPITWSHLVLGVKKGSSGGRARAAQTALNRHGAGLAVDGDFGGVSVTATKSFQRKKGLVADGYIGPITWQALV